MCRDEPPEAVFFVDQETEALEGVVGSGSHGQPVRGQGVHPPFLPAPYIRLAKCMWTSFCILFTSTQQFQIKQLQSCVAQTHTFWSLSR